MCIIPAPGITWGEKISPPEANPLGVEQYARQGIVGRGVLVTWPGISKSRAGVEPISRDAITVTDFKDALAAQNTVLQEATLCFAAAVG